MGRNASVRGTLVLLTLVVLGCQGDVGPMGPAGPQGPAGPGTRTAYLVRADANGTAAQAMPAGLTITSPPVLTCFTSDTPAGPFIGVPSGGQGVCGFVTSGSTLQAVVIQVPANWWVLFVIAY